MERNKMERVLLLLACYFLIAVHSYPKHSKFHAKPQTERAVHRDIVSSDDSKHEGSTETALLPNTLTGLSREPSTGVVDAQVVVNNGHGDRTKLHRINLDDETDPENHRGETETAVVSETHNTLGDENRDLDNLNRHGATTTKVITVGNNGLRDDERAEALTNRLADTLNSAVNGHPANGVNGVVLNTNRVVDTTEPLVSGTHHQGSQENSNHYITNSVNDLQGQGKLIQLEEHHRIASFRDEAQNQNHNTYHGTSNLDRGNLLTSTLPNRLGTTLLSNGRTAGNQVITLNIPTVDTLRGINTNNDALIAKLINTLRDNLNNRHDIGDPRTLSQSLTSTIADTLETASNNGQNPNHISLRDIVDLVNGLRGNYQTSIARGDNVVATSPITITGTVSDGEGNTVNHEELVGRLKNSFSSILNDLLTRNGDVNTITGNRISPTLQGNRLNVDLNENRIINDRVGDRVATDLNGNRVVTTDRINNLNAAERLQDEECAEGIRPRIGCTLNPTTGKVVVVKQGNLDGTRHTTNVLGNVADVEQPNFEIRLASNGVNDGLVTRPVNQGAVTATTTATNNEVGPTVNGVNAVEGRREELVRLAGMLNQVLRGINVNNSQEIQAIRKATVSKSKNDKTKKKIKSVEKKIKKVEKQVKKEKKSKSNLKKLKASKSQMKQ